MKNWIKYLLIIELQIIVILLVFTLVKTEKLDNNLVKSFGAEEKVYPFRGDYLPLVDIAKILNIAMVSENGERTALVFVNTERKAFGIPVDEVLDPQQIIVKTLETNYRSVKGIAGATILRDGSVSLVLDLLGIEDIFFKNSFKGDTTDEGEEKAE